MKEHEPALKISPEISRRDFFAAFALAGLCTNSEVPLNLPEKAIADYAYKQADAMIEEDEK